jgi:hypothetical protein
MSKEWWTPLVGVAFVIVVVLSFTIGGEPPDAGDPPAEIVEHYVDNKDAIRVGALLSGLAGALAIFFAGILRKVLRRAEGEGGVLSLVAFAGAVIITVGAAVDATISFAIAEAVEDIEPTSVQTLQALWDNDFVPFAVGMFVLLIASGLSIVRHRALPTWLGWAAIVLGVVALTPAGFVAFFGILLWVLAVSIVMTMQARATPGEPPPPPAATMPA